MGCGCSVFCCGAPKRSRTSPVIIIVNTADSRLATHKDVQDATAVAMESKEQVTRKNGWLDIAIAEHQQRSISPISRHSYNNRGNIPNNIADRYIS
jgi:hypothetical protein